MKPYKLEFQRFEMLTDDKARGKTKQKIQKKVRQQLKRAWKKDVKDQEENQ